MVNCGRRFGKDILDIDLAICQIVIGHNVGWFQPSYKSLVEVWRMMKRVLKPITSKVSEQDKRIECITGGVIEFWSLDGDPESCRGRKYHFVILNEAAKARYLKIAWEMAIRPTLTDYRGSAIFTSTPRGRDYYHELYQRSMDAVQSQWWMSWTKPTTANPHIPIDEIEQAKNDLPTTTFLQEYEAEFLDVAGAFFDEWQPNRQFTDFDEASGKYVERIEPWHVVPPFVIPDYWDQWGALDYGTSKNSKTFAFGLLASDEEGGVILTDEIYASGLLAEAQVEAVLQLLAKRGLAWPADPNHPEGLWETKLKFITMDYASTFPPADPKDRIGKYPVEYYWERGLPCIAASKRREAGWAEFKRWLHNAIAFKRRDDGTEDIRAAFRVFAGRCSDTIRTIPQIVRSDKNPEDIHGENQNQMSSEDKQEDHLCFVAGTKITTERGLVAIEDLKHDMVLTRQGYFPICGWSTTREDRVYTVLFSNGHELTGTGNHPVWVQGRGFIRIDVLRQDDLVLTQLEARSSHNLSRLIRAKGNAPAPVHVVSVRAAGSARTYNLSVEGPHEYFANGVLVSNCDMVRYGLMTRPGMSETPAPPGPNAKSKKLIDAGKLHPAFAKSHRNGPVTPRE